MEISYGKQISVDEIAAENIDLFIFAVNHEQRGFTLFNKLKKQKKIRQSIAFCYENNCDATIEQGVEKKIIKSNEGIYNILDEIFQQHTGDEINIVVDYSCMTKYWYYSIILYLTKREIKIKKIITFFSYTPSKFSEPQSPKPNIDIAPLPGKYIVPTDKPKALIVCLGYEQNKAEGIIDHLDPKISIIFYTDPASQPEFVATLRENNKNILADKSDFVITYPFDDLLFLEQKLTAIYHALKNDYSIIIAPIGPKPFTFISMLLSVKYSDIDIWRVGSGSDINIYDRSPIEGNSFIVSEIVFLNNLASLPQEV